MIQYINNFITHFFWCPQFATINGFPLDYKDKDEDPLKIFTLFKKGEASGAGSQTVVEVPQFTAPPAAPQSKEAASVTEAITPEDEEERQKQAMKQGAKSLQIPLTTGASTTKQVGTGT